MTTLNSLVRKKLDNNTGQFAALPPTQYIITNQTLQNYLCRLLFIEDILLDFSLQKSWGDATDIDY